MRLVRRFARFWYDFIVGDDWRLAIGVVLTAVVVSFGTHLGTNVWWLPPLAIGALLGSSVHVAFRRPPTMKSNTAERSSGSAPLVSRTTPKAGLPKRRSHMKRSKTTAVPVPNPPMTNAALAQHARTTIAYHGERILAEIPRTLRRIGLLVMVLAVTIPVFSAGLLVVLWRLGN